MPARRKTKDMKVMYQAADLLKQLREQKKELEERLESLKGQIEKADGSLSGMMAETGTENFVHAEMTFYLKNCVKANARDGMTERMHAALRENGAGELITETVNANSLNAYVKRVMKNGEVPAWLDEVVAVTEKTIVGLRKAK